MLDRNDFVSHYPSAVAQELRSIPGEPRSLLDDVAFRRAEALAIRSREALLLPIEPMQICEDIVINGPWRSISPYNVELHIAHYQNTSSGEQLRELRVRLCGNNKNIGYCLQMRLDTGNFVFVPADFNADLFKKRVSSKGAKSNSVKTEFIPEIDENGNVVGINILFCSKKSLEDTSSKLDVILSSRP